VSKRRTTVGARVRQAGEIRSESEARMYGLRTSREGAYASNEASDSDRGLGREQRRLSALERRLVEHHLPHAGESGRGRSALLAERAIDPWKQKDSAEGHLSAPLEGHFWSHLVNLLILKPQKLVLKSISCQHGSRSALLAVHKGPASETFSY
jgi:hypothetical protein